MGNPRFVWLIAVVFILAGTPVWAQFTTADTLKAVVPGLVYKEFSRVITTSNNDYRVTDPNATFVGDPNNSPSTYLPNHVLSLAIDDLQGAIRAVAVIDCWGGHVGTVGKQFRLNGNSWVDIPSIANTPADPECYTHQYSIEVEVPVADLVQGANSLEGTSGGQTCHNFGWGQWGWYSFHLRVFYDPSQKTPPTGAITSPVDGAVIGEFPSFAADAFSDVGISRVEFVGRYEDVDADGDGVFLDWQQSYHRLRGDSAVTIRNHIGTADFAPFGVVWDNSWLPNQPAAGIEAVARIRDNTGLWAVTEAVTGLTLDRPGLTVELYQATNTPTNYWVRAGATKSNNFQIAGGHDLTLAESARMYAATWNGVSGQAEPGQDHWTEVNGWTTPGFGRDHRYSFDLIDIPTNVLQNGTNTISFYSASSHHGAEVLWPGPGLLVRYVDYSNVSAVIVTQPASTYAVEGSTATFTVAAVGADPLSYQWQKNGMDISGANAPSHTTPPVTALNDGDLYRCVVTNFLGSDTSAEATLLVLVPGNRNTLGQIVLYDFDELSGDMVRDRSGVGPPADLVIGDIGAVNWLPGALNVSASTVIATVGAVPKLVDAVMLSNEISIEAWLRPANLTQNGPARIVTLSPNLVSRNFTLGQGVFGAASDAYEVRLRSTQTTGNGTPALATAAGALSAQLSHVVFTRDQTGATRIYVDGAERASGGAAGNLSNWDSAFRLALANELTGDRPWFGELHLVAVFDRALTTTDILQNLAAGPNAAPEIHAHVFPAQALAGPVSLYALPNGGGEPLTAAQFWNGVPGTLPVAIDATIAVQLLDGFGDPVVGFAPEKITVMAQGGGWSLCPDSPLIADGPTDATGTTTISGTLHAGGFSGVGELLQVTVNDPALASVTYPGGLSGLEYFVNSADITGDLDVSLVDVAAYAAIHVGGGYDYAADYFRDGAINLSDVAKLAVGHGAECVVLPGKGDTSGDPVAARSAATIGISFAGASGASGASSANARMVRPGERIEAYVFLAGPAAERGVDAFDVRIRVSENVVIHQQKFLGEGFNISPANDFVVGYGAPRRASATGSLRLAQLQVSVTDAKPAHFWVEPSESSDHLLPVYAADGEVHGARPVSGEVALPVASLNDENFVLADSDIPVIHLSLGVAPNPFNPQTEIRFRLPTAGPVMLRVYDTRGQLVTVLRNEVMAAGAHDVAWRGTDGTGRGVASGVYFAQLHTPDGVRLEKMVLLK